MVKTIFKNLEFLGPLLKLITLTVFFRSKFLIKNKDFLDCSIVHVYQF